MSKFWSDYIQTTDELNLSRELRFTDENHRLWLDAIGAENFDCILEVGCGGGVFCARLKRYLPDIDITGIDLDEAHISRAGELYNGINFVVGDATRLPFSDESFDLCFSHTVAEHIPHDAFFGEQYRVLKKGGRISVLSARPKLGIREESLIPDEAWEIIKPAFENDNVDDSLVGAFEMAESDYPRELEKYGFSDVRVGAFTVMYYSPDSAKVTRDDAIKQINYRRMSELAFVSKVARRSGGALDEDKLKIVEAMINSAYDERLAKYDRGEHLWDIASSTVLWTSGIKM